MEAMKGTVNMRVWAMTHAKFKQLAERARRPMTDLLDDLATRLLDHGEGPGIRLSPPLQASLQQILQNRQAQGERLTLEALVEEILAHYCQKHQLLQAGEG